MLLFCPDNFYNKLSECPAFITPLIPPEAAVGGPIALVEEGDIISIDIPGLKLELKVSDEELAARKAKWQPREPKVTTGYLKRYASLVTSGNRGAILKSSAEE